MISFRDSVEIRTTPEQLFAWLERMPQEYTSWHPDHVSCRVLQGSMLAVGSEIECQEILHGKSHTLRFRMTKVIPGRRAEFEIAGMGRGAFEAQSIDGAATFKAQLDIGVDMPVIGWFFDFVFSRLFGQRIESMRQHMAEEGQNLKAILESGPSKGPAG